LKGEIPLALTFDDVLLVPKRSSLRSRREANTSTYFTRKIRLNIPLVSSPMDTVTEDKMAITIARMGGIGVVHRYIPIDKQAEMVRRVKRAENIVIEEPYKISPDERVQTAREIMDKYDVSGLMVVRGGELVGIITHRDIQFETDSRRVYEVMTPKERLITADPDISIDEAKEILRTHKIEKLPLVDKSGRLAGLITAIDIVKREMYPNAARDRKGRLLVAAAVGVREGYLKRVKSLIEADADAIVIDVAHGHMDLVINAIKEIKKIYGDVQVVGGNVATPEGVEDLAAAGADAVRVGIGPGSICTTRIVTGVGVPQITAIMKCYEKARDIDIPLVADGGIRFPGDVVKALAAGASTLMIGRLFAGTDESPGSIILRNGRRYKIYRGMASFYARLGKEEAEKQILDLDDIGDYAFTAEGVEAFVEYRGSVEEVVNRLISGLRAGMSYLGARTIEELRNNAEFVRVSDAGWRESLPHDIEME
jgi:IMP dehydrogenase